MHFVDKDSFDYAPMNALVQYHKKEQIKWLRYKNKNRRSEPKGFWTEDEIRTPLIQLFLSNCGYCGKFVDKDEGEVDHYFPKSHDELALYIYDWDNYIWSCPGCNGEKNNYFYVLNPCRENHTKDIFFHAADGRYLYKSDADPITIHLFNNTEKWTLINRTSRTKNRVLWYKRINILISQIRGYFFELKHIIEWNTSHSDFFTVQQKLHNAFREMKSWLQTDYRFLAKSLITKANQDTPDEFPYNFEFFLNEV